MTKSEYMGALREKLQHYNRALEMEILDDYEQHFAEGLAEGRREEDIIAELGNIDDMLKEFSEEDLKQELETVESQANQSNSYKQFYRAVVIEGLLADVEVTASEDEQIRIEYDNCGSKAQKMRYHFYQYEQDGVFYAGVRERTGADRGEAFTPESGFDSIWNAFFKFSQFTNWSGEDIHLNVQIPARIPSIRIETTSGELWVRGIQTREMETRCLSGDMRIEDVACEKFSGKTQSGEMEVSGMNMKLEGDTMIEVQTTSGDLEVRDIAAAAVRLQTASGDVSAERLRAGRLRIQTASGEQKLEDIVCDLADLRSGSGDIGAENMQGREVSVATGSGDVELAADMEDYDLKAGSGDIDLETGARAREIHMATASGDLSLDLSRVAGASIVSRTHSGDMIIRGYEVSGHTYNTSYGSGVCQVRLSTASGDITVE